MDLSEVEKIILRSLANGMQSKEIAQIVGRSKPTIEGYVRLLFAKFNARSRAQLVAMALPRGVIEEELESIA